MTRSAMLKGNVLSWKSKGAGMVFREAVEFFLVAVGRPDKLWRKPKSIVAFLRTLRRNPRLG
jgi:hypothetical protein